MRSFAQIALVIVTSFAMASCSDKRDQSNQKSISSVDLGAFRLSDSIRKDARKVGTVDDGIVNFTICEIGGPKCGPELSIANIFGVHVSVYAKSKHLSLYPIGEKPTNAEPLMNIPMNLLPPSIVGKCCEAGSNFYPLSRLNLGKRDASFQTTSALWPIASCYDVTPNSWICGVGFSVQGSFVEVRFGRKDHEFPSQSEIWAFASGIDAFIRAHQIGNKGK